MAWVAVHDPQRMAEDVAAMRIHGFYTTMHDAQVAARALASDQLDVRAYVVDHCCRWIRVREPEPGTGDDEEEVAAPENNDPSGGRMGSVCNIRDRVEVVQDDVAPPPGVVFDHKKPASGSQAKESNRQRSQLERLLREDPTGVSSVAAYGALRERHALLCAFDRRLKGLFTDGLHRCQVATDAIHALDGRHPDFQEQYLTNYRRALRESGMKTEDVAFMRFLQGPCGN